MPPRPQNHMPQQHPRRPGLGHLLGPQITTVGGGQFEFGRHRHPELKTEHTFVVCRRAFVPDAAAGHHPLDATLGQHAALAVFTGGVFIGRIAMDQVGHGGNAGVRVHAKPGWLPALRHRKQI